MADTSKEKLFLGGLPVGAFFEQSIGGSEGKPRGVLPPLDSSFAPLGLFKQWSQPL